MSSSIITAVYAGGIFQSLILIAVIIRKKVFHQRANQILLALLSAICVVLIQYILITTRSGLTNRFVSELGTICWFAIGPLSYLYASGKSQQHFRFKTQHIFIFAVPIYNLLQYLTGFIVPGLALYYLFDSDITYSYSWLLAYMVHTLIFVGLAIFVLRKTADSQHKRLLKFFYLWLGVLVSCTVYLLFNMNSTAYFYNLELYLFIVFNVFVLMLSYESLMSATNFEGSVPLQKEVKYSNSSLSNEQLSTLHQKLVQVMETDKPYMDRKLNLAQLSKASGIRENQLSQIFSQYLKSSFYDFISQYRLTEVEQRLNDPRYAHLKIISLAEDCGFNSKAAFYKTFKEKHQLTPTQYMKERKAS